MKTKKSYSTTASKNGKQSNGKQLNGKQSNGKSTNGAMQPSQLMKLFEDQRSRRRR